jgi:hypothetical protein
MFKFGSMCLVTGTLCAAGAALAADLVKNQVIPNFATTDRTGWVLDRSVGVDDLLPPPTGGPGPVTFDRAILMCPTAAVHNRPIALPIFPIRSCSPGPFHR